MALAAFEMCRHLASETLISKNNDTVIRSAHFESFLNSHRQCVPMSLLKAFCKAYERKTQLYFEDEGVMLVA